MSCYICNNDQEELLESHHIVPRRFGGSDVSENLVDLCPNCHRAIESMYDKRFYEALDVEKESDEAIEPQECANEKCGSHQTTKLVNQRRQVELWVCDEHKYCKHPGCDGKRVTPIPGEFISLRCETHRKCAQSGCQAKDTLMQDKTGIATLPYCDKHLENNP